MQNVLKRKIYVSSDRGKELQQLQQQAEMAARGEPDRSHPASGEPDRSHPNDTMPPTKNVPPTEPEYDGIDARRVPILLLGFNDDQVRFCKKK